MNRDQMIETATGVILNNVGEKMASRSLAAEVVDAIFPQVTTVEEWEALPTWTVVVSSDGTPYIKGPLESSSDVLISWLTEPMTVVWQP